MGYGYGIDISTDMGLQRVHDTSFPPDFNEEDYQRIIETKALPEKYVVHAMHCIRQIHKEIELSTAVVSIRKDGMAPVELVNTVIVD